MNNYEEQIKELKEKLAKLEAELEESKKKETGKRWKPQEEECYYFVDDEGVGFHYWDDDTIDEYLYLTQNCFKTREEAEEHKKEIETYFKFKNYVEEHSEPLDWKNEYQKKYYIYCNSNYIFFDNVYVNLAQGTIYASSEQILRDAIDYIGGEEVAKRYLFGIKE